jgi:ubiquinone biosynthesis protein UbiJ
MSAQGEQLTDFERRARVALEESVLRIDGRVRSRLNQARQAAIEASESRRSPLFSRFFTLVPTASAAAAALLVAVFLVHQGPQKQEYIAPVVHEQLRTGAEDLDLLADSDGLDLVEEGGDGSGSFYEWAADQTEASGGGEKTDT